MEGDSGRLLKMLEINDFNPLPPHGGRLVQNSPVPEIQKISIHSLRMEGDAIVNRPVLVSRDFNPLPPHGGRPVL